MNLTISFISEDLVIECVAASYVLPPGDNDMYDDMPELEDYVDVVADLLELYTCMDLCTKTCLYLRTTSMLLQIS